MDYARIHSRRAVFSRREVLALGAGLGAAAALGIAPARAAAKPVLTRPIPRTGETLPVIGLGTAIIFDIGRRRRPARRAQRGHPDPARRRRARDRHRAVLRHGGERGRRPACRHEGPRQGVCCDQGARGRPRPRHRRDAAIAAPAAHRQDRPDADPQRRLRGPRRDSGATGAAARMERRAACSATSA